MSEGLWWAANILVSVLAISIAYHDGLGSAVVIWGILTLVLMAIRPD